MSRLSAVGPALVIGSRGQDGSYLVEQLIASGRAVVGVSREEPIDLSDAAAIRSFVAEIRPAEIFYLAARHGSSEQGAPGEPSLLEESFSTHVQGLVHFLEAMRFEVPDARLLYAASAHVFGSEPAETPQSETTPLRPDSPYAITKAAGLEYCRYYRRRYDLHCSGAILFNHESPRRRPEFVSQRIVRGVAAIREGRSTELTVGSLSSIVDWGWAPDYVDAMIRIVRVERAEDFVVATGEPHTVADFVSAAFAAAGIDDWERYVREVPAKLLVPRKPLVGDATRLREMTGWKPTLRFEEMVAALWRASSSPLLE